MVDASGVHASDGAASDDDEPAKLEPGGSAGRYRIVRELGAGGMGIEYVPQPRG